MKANKNPSNPHSVAQTVSNSANHLGSTSANKTLENLLAPFAGNELFYRRLIHIFETNLQQQLQNLDQMILDNNTKDILVIIHTLKGSSGSTGLSSLHLALVDGEKKLKQAYDENAANLDLVCEELIAHVRAVAQAELSSIHSLLLNSSVTDTPAPAEDYSSAELTSTLAELKQHLIDGNLNALDVTLRLQNMLSDKVLLQQDLASLHDTVEMLDFEQALDALASLSQKL